MKQETVFIRTDDFGKKPFIFPFLYETKEGEKINHEYEVGGETFRDTYEIVEISKDKIYDIKASIIRTIYINLLDGYEH